MRDCFLVHSKPDRIKTKNLHSREKEEIIDPVKMLGRGHVVEINLLQSLHSSLTGQPQIEINHDVIGSRHAKFWLKYISGF